MRVLYYNPYERILKVKVASQTLQVNQEISAEDKEVVFSIDELFALAKTQIFDNVEVYFAAHNQAYVKQNKKSKVREEVVGWISLKNLKNGGGYLADTVMPTATYRADGESLYNHIDCETNTLQFCLSRLKNIICRYVLNELGEMDRNIFSDWLGFNGREKKKSVLAEEYNMSLDKIKKSLSKSRKKFQYNTRTNANSLIPEVEETRSLISEQGLMKFLTYLYDEGFTNLIKYFLSNISSDKLDYVEFKRLANRG